MDTCSKTCFQCGQHGHVQSHCEQLSQTEAGADAFLRYQNAWLAAKKPKKIKPKRHHFHKFQRWLHSNAEDNLCDPLTLVTKHITMQKGRPVSFELKKMAELSYREFFMDIIERTRHRFSGETTKKEHNELWEQALNYAVKAGEPADFSQIQSNRVYADNKLIYRTRYLYQLLMDNNHLSVKLRSKLLPSFLRDHQVEVREKSQRSDVVGAIRVASIGGGPGYDHLAVCLVAWFLFKVQISTCSDVGGINYRHSDFYADLKPPVIQTQIFDLFDKEWLPIMVDLDEAFREEHEHMCEEGQLEGEEGRQREKEWWSGNHMSMHHGDLRRRAPASSCSVGRGDKRDGDKGDALLLHTVLHTDIFICQFVLHENASFLVDEGLLTGLIASVLKDARVGAFLVCTDSGNRLWPALKATAHKCGWEFWSDEENVQIGHKIMFGPKAFVILERVHDV